MKRNFLLGLVASAALMGLGSVAQAESAIVVQVAPPAPIHEVIPAPRQGYTWAPGHYAFRDGEYVWVRGHWMTARNGSVWREAHWRQRDDGSWVFVEGHWSRGDRYGMNDNNGERFAYGRDFDRDGVPNRYDNDRDGDGVPNRYDAYPDNPYRN